MKAREDFYDKQKSLPIENLIFIDESGCHPGIGPRRGWAQQGEALYGPEQVYSRKQHISIIGAMSIDGIVAKATVRGGVGTQQFRRFIEKHLVPILKPGHIVCMDNLAAHKSKAVRELIEATGATILFFPAYSPDLNPIEAAWAKVKHLVRKHCATAVPRLRQAIYKALRKITSSDIEGYFRYAGYGL